MEILEKEKAFFEDLSELLRKHNVIMCGGEESSVFFESDGFDINGFSTWLDGNINAEAVNVFLETGGKWKMYR